MNFKTLILSLLILSIVACSQKTKTYTIKTSEPHLKVIFSFNSQSYPWLMGKKYPQMAVWIKEKKTGYTKTIFVTKSAAEKKWFGSKERPSSIPVWYGINNKNKIKVDAISGATPSGSSYEIKWQIPKKLIGKTIDIYIEANVSFDYNSFYKKKAKKGTASYSGVNGQPSLIWMTSLNMEKTSVSAKPEIIGHGHIMGKSHKIQKDLSQITTAKNLFNYIKIIYSKGSK